MSRRPSTSTVVPGTGGPRPRGARSCRLAPRRGLGRLGRLRGLRRLRRLRGLGGLRGAARPGPRPPPASSSSSTSVSSPTALAVGWRPRAALASRTLASRAAMRSTTLSSATGVGAATISSPAALRSMRSSTWLRCMSSNFSGSNGSVSDSISWVAILISRSLTSSSTHVLTHQLGGVVDLVGIDHRRHDQHAVLGAQGGQVLLRPHDEAGDGDLVLLLHGPGEQRVGLLGRLVGGHVVGRVVVDRVDLVEVDELLDVDAAAGLGVERRSARRRPPARTRPTRAGSPWRSARSAPPRRRPPTPCGTGSGHRCGCRSG